MDEADIANDRVLLEMELKLREMRSRMTTSTRTTCKDCEDPIHPARIALSYALCIHCARDREKK